MTCLFESKGRFRNRIDDFANCFCAEGFCTKEGNYNQTNNKFLKGNIN